MARNIQNWIVFVVGLLLMPLMAASNIASSHDPSITVLLYDDAGVSSAVMHAAEQEAGRIFSHSGIRTSWRDCSSTEPMAELECRPPFTGKVLMMRVIPHARTLGPTLFGVSYLGANGSGAYGDVFYDRVLHLHEVARIDTARLLGYVLAHELGHLLLGSNAHASVGIMRAQWAGNDLSALSRGTFLFSSAQAGQMRGGIEAADRHPAVAVSALKGWKRPWEACAPETACVAENTVAGR